MILLLIVTICLFNDTTAAKEVMRISLKKRRDLHKLHSRAEIEIAPLYNSSHLLEYLGLVQVGTPGQQMHFSFDTTSYDTWVQSSGCDSCDSKSSFQPDLSSTYHPIPRFDRNDMNYLDGSSMHGTFFEDTIAIGKVKISNFTMIRAESMRGYTHAPEFDGILGLRINSKKKIGFVDRAFREGLIPQPQLSFYIDDRTETGEMIIGGYNTSKIDGDIVWSSISNIQFASDHSKSPQEFWSMKLNSYHLHFRDRSQTLYVDGQVIFNTALSCSLISKNAAEMLLDQLGVDFNHDKLNENGKFQFPCSQISRLPNITIALGGFNITVTGSEYALSDSTGCFLAFMADDNLPSVQSSLYFSVLGMSLLRKFYLVFDYGSSQIGFGKIKLHTETVTLPYIPSPSPSFTPSSASSSVNTFNVLYGLCVLLLFF